jgi:hypothetical protein
MGASSPSSSTLTFAFPLPLDLLVDQVQGISGYLLAGLALILVLSIALQLRAARQLRRTMRDMNHILDLVEAIQCEIPSAPAVALQPSSVSTRAAVVAPPAAAPTRTLTHTERAVLESIAEHGELHEQELRKILEGKGFPQVLIKAVISDLVPKTAAESLPWVEARHVQGRFTYRLRVRKGSSSHDERWAE